MGVGADLASKGVRAVEAALRIGDLLQGLRRVAQISGDLGREDPASAGAGRLSETEAEFFFVGGGCVHVRNLGGGVGRCADELVEVGVDALGAVEDLVFAEGAAFGCDLSYEYVRINGDYRT